jgi:hypothetical protein
MCGNQETGLTQSRRMGRLKSLAQNESAKGEMEWPRAASVRMQMPPFCTLLQSLELAGRFWG